tara:strand:- start:2971 stop:4836 length:1866 start_codon:yes stop_codon:yes gene_type:complete
MTDKTFFGRLRRLFSTGTIVKRTSKGLKVADLNKIQSNQKLATNKLVDRFNKIYQSDNYGYNQQANFHTLRLSLYTDYELMDEDSIISSALDIYADESTLKNEYGNVLTINSENEKVQKVLNNLFYDVLNIEFNAWPWVRNMCKYGDLYLKMDITETVGVTNAVALSPYEMYREEGLDPENPDLVEFTHDPSMAGQTAHANSKGVQTKYGNYEIGHFRLLNDMNFLPYGKSMIEPARKTYKQLTLMEDAMLIHRIMRAPEKRVYKIDIGNIPPAEVDTYMQRVIQQMKKTPYLDPKTGQYNLRFNMANMMEDVYLPVRGGNTGTEIDTMSGMEFGGIEDVEYLKHRMFAALKIPKAFLGYEEGVEGKATLAAQDVRFARTIERIQRIFVSELTKIAMVHLYSQGFTSEELVDFSLELTCSSTIHEQEKIELWSQKLDLISSIKDGRIISEEWAYKNILNMSEEEMQEQQRGVVQDRKRYFRHNEIEGGNDPVKSGEAKSTEWALQMGAQPPSGEEGGFDAQPQNTDDLWSESPEDVQENKPGQGRPKEGPKPGTQKSARGRDPLAKEERKRDSKLKNNKGDRKFEGKQRRSMAINIFDELGKKNKNKSSLLNEENILKDDI